MKIIEILLPVKTDSEHLSKKTRSKLDMLTTRMDQYVDKIMDPDTSPRGREFLKARLKDDYAELKNIIPSMVDTVVTEAITRLPLTSEDFNAVIEVMQRPIPAAIAPIYISEIIEDDELNGELEMLGETEPNRDIRPLIAEWFKRVMPDQMFRFIGDDMTENQKNGVFSPIHGYDSGSFKSTNEPIIGNAFGRF